jgi:hypothetical protein
VSRSGDRRVPQVPPLDVIADPAVRAVLEPLVQGWQMRNGGTPVTDQHKFLTKADIIDLATDGTLMPGIGGTGLGPGGAPLTGLGDQVQTLVNAAVDFVRNSEFFQFLGQRIDLILPDLNELRGKTDQLTTYVKQTVVQRSDADNAIVESLNQVFAGMFGGAFPVWAMSTDGLTLRVNNAGAFVQHINQLSATVGGHTTLIQQETTTRADQMGRLYGQWALRIDQDGFVSGFGMNSRSDGAGAETSEFYIRADVFAVGSPNHSRQVTGTTRDLFGNVYPVYAPPDAANIPFVVFTNPQTQNGRVIPPGVYMNTAFISAGAIGQAQIGFAAIDTLLVGGHAITTPFAASGGSIGSPGGTIISVAAPFPAIQFTIPDGTTVAIPTAPSAVVVGGCVTFSADIGHDGGIGLSIKCNGSALNSTFASVLGSYSGSLSLFAVNTNPGLNDVYSLSVSNSGGSTGTFTNAAIFVMGAKR